MDDSPLARLPQELRNYVYELAVTSDKPIRVSTEILPRWQAPGLLQCCHQSRNEASGIYFGGNTFSVNANAVLNTRERMHYLLETWLLALGPTTRSLVRHIRLDDEHCTHQDEVHGRIAFFKLCMDRRGVLPAQAEISVELRFGWRVNEVGF